MASLTPVLERLERDRAEHVLGERSSEGSLGELEAAIGLALPADYRAFLTRIGGSLLYQRHECLGPHRVFVHDIDLVPDLMTVRAALADREPAAAAELLTFHRSKGSSHGFVIRDGAVGDTIRSGDGETTYSGLAEFFEAVVLPPAGG